MSALSRPADPVRDVWVDLDGDVALDGAVLDGDVALDGEAVLDGDVALDSGAAVPVVRAAVPRRRFGRPRVGGVGCPGADVEGAVGGGIAVGVSAAAGPGGIPDPVIPDEGATLVRAAPPSSGVRVRLARSPAARAAPAAKASWGVAAISPPPSAVDR